MQEVRLIEIKEEVLADNGRMAGELRERLTGEGCLLLNIMASPGAGKTSLILRTLEGLKHDFRLGVLEADIDSMVDSEKIAALEVPVVQLRTGGFCHLDAAMVARGLDYLNTKQLDLIIIENVGNLVCPAEFDTGAHRKVMILSVPEGDDKPLKYPLMFTVSDVLVLNKTDYLQAAGFDLEALRRRVLRLNPDIRIFEVSCRTGEGIKEWIGWVAGQLAGTV
ncbi:MAG: hydrogenase nickel incorporation protein HypB [Desulfohalobiaceae bacterium]|nr:hydrogenase nickel incorporation protein HypB [Desulfohalobiaceae bacterium]